MARKRINISVDERTYAALDRIRKVYGFKNLCELSAALLHLVVRYVDAAEARASADNEEDINIEQMFNEFGGWEDTPDGIPPVHRHHKTIYDRYDRNE